MNRSRSFLGVAMNDQMFIETLIISSSFFAIAAVIVISVLILERGSWTLTMRGEMPPTLAGQYADNRQYWE